MMSTSKQYNVVVSGRVLEGYELEHALTDFADKFKLGPEKARKLLESATPVSVKKGVDLNTANSYQKAIESTGLESTVEPCLNQSLSSDPTLQTVYNAPSAAVSQDVERMEFGGWLKVFQVLHIITLAFAVLAFIAGVGLSMLEEVSEELGAELLVGLIEVVPVLVFNLLILLVVKNRDKTTPRKISAYLNFKLIGTIAVYWLLNVFYYDHIELSAGEELGQSIGMLLSIGYCWAWIIYFKRSKRVAGYYCEPLSSVE